MRLEMTWIVAFIFAKQAAEWFYTSVNSVMCPQIFKSFALVVNVDFSGAAECFFSSRNSFMCLWIGCLCEFLVTVTTRELFWNHLHVSNTDVNWRQVVLHTGKIYFPPFFTNNKMLPWLCCRWTGYHSWMWHGCKLKRKLALLKINALQWVYMILTQTHPSHC